MKEFLAQFGIKKKMALTKIGNAYFKVHDAQLLKKRPVYSGECIAHIRGQQIIPGIDFLQQLGKEAKNKVVVDAKGEWLLICGRDVPQKHIRSDAEGVVVVLNQHKECIGYGKREKLGIKRFFDIGDLLRRERKSRKVKAF